ncbi:MAG: hypothetical protein RI925_1081 [Pseudomonadota bacterium]|jgi:ParB family chromosome partitioning protein
MVKPKGLGRGLDALLAVNHSDDQLQTLPVTAIQPGKYQPRTRMDAASLESLAESIRAQGVIQPLVVRPVGYERYELIAGERRWRACQLAGLSEVAAIVRTVPDEAALAMALIENIQREGLNPLEEALGLKRLADEFGMTHEAVAAAVGRSRSAVSNLLRLLNLAEPVQALVNDGKLDMGHARALLTLPVMQQVSLAQDIAERGLSVRDAEQRAQQLLHPPLVRPQAGADPDVLRLAEEVSERVGARVMIRPGKHGSGKLLVEYASLDQLDTLIAALSRRS